MLAVASVGRPGDDSSLGDVRTAIRKGWDPGMMLCNKAEMATTRKKNSHLFFFSKFLFYICLYFILTRLHRPREDKI